MGHTGWRSTRYEIGRLLERLGADRDEQGRFLLSWGQGGSGLGGDGADADADGVLVSDDVRYRIRGYWAPLAPALRRSTRDVLRMWEGG